MIQEFDRVVLTENLPEYSLLQGDVSTVVLVHQAGKGFEVEFVKLNGETFAVTSLLAAQVCPIHAHEVPHARELGVA
ncbi:MAG: DUF4926 domain-containing protein [Leptolyngbyaceae cyanobacterium bins.302]|nr:DUF4926 domain-containing protein [Leptolyngbyaceae cyanobacterium bins.302]